MSLLVRLSLLILCAAVAGCSGGANRIDAIYTISALEQPPATGATTAQILVPEPRALESLNTNKIAVKPTVLTLSYYPNVALEDSATKVFQKIMLDTFQNTGRVRAVGLPGQSLLINYQVVTEVRAFQVETFAGNRARVEIAVKLLNDSNGRVVSNRVFSAVVPLSSDAVETAAEGMNAATRQVSLEIVEWTLASI